MDRDPAAGPGQLTLFDEPPHAEDAPRRSALLGGRALEFRFRRRRRRTIGLRVDEHGLSVAAPLRAPWREIEGFLRDKAAWILEKLDERAALGSPVTIFGETGEILPLHGREVTLAVVPGGRGVALEGAELRVALPQPQNRGAVRRLLLAWLK
ncbi:MAG: YgjP-like metallopeptidase domain-containing protein, partial [Burkholderiales bacterium]